LVRRVDDNSIGVVALVLLVAVIDVASGLDDATSDLLVKELLQCRALFHIAESVPLLAVSCIGLASRLHNERGHQSWDMVALAARRALCHSSSFDLLALI